MLEPITLSLMILSCASVGPTDDCDQAIIPNVPAAKCLDLAEQLNQAANSRFIHVKCEPSEIQQAPHIQQAVRPVSLTF